MALFGLFGGGDDVSQETNVTVDNQNNFSPTVQIALNGLDAIGAFVRDGLEAIAGSTVQQNRSTDQSGLNISNAIDGAGVNISNSISGGADSLGESVSELGANIGFSVIAGLTVIGIGLAATRGK